MLSFTKANYLRSEILVVRSAQNWHRQRVTDGVCTDFFDKEYHVEGSRLQRFAWFRRKQELHFVHHRHANSNFAVIHFFWDRFLVPIKGRMLDRLRRMEPSSAGTPGE
jgi:hypothetical protein